MKYRNFYLVTTGNPDGDNLTLLCACDEDELEEVLLEKASEIAGRGGDISSIRVWNRSPMAVKASAFVIEALPAQARKK